MKTHKVCNLRILHFYKPGTHTRNNVIKIVILLLNMTIENYDLLSNIDNLNGQFISSKNPDGYCEMIHMAIVRTPQHYTNCD